MRYLKYFETLNNTLDISNRNIRKTDMYLKYFGNDNITQIQMDHNKFKSIPILPKHLTILCASSNILEELPELPNTLIELYVPYNNLSKLPKIPNSLIKLSCGQNKLTELPKLPESLQILYCENNRLTKLPELPNSLTVLHVGLNNWVKPLSYELINKYNLRKQRIQLYTDDQKEKFGSYKYQKEFLTKNPEKYKDLEPFGYNVEIKYDFDWIFNASDMGLM